MGEIVYERPSASHSDPSFVAGLAVQGKRANLQKGRYAECPRISGTGKTIGNRCSERELFKHRGRSVLVEDLAEDHVDPPLWPVCKLGHSLETFSFIHSWGLERLSLPV